MENTRQKFEPLSAEVENLGLQIVEIAISIHKALGPGLLESVYEKCFCYELKNRKIPFKRQSCIGIQYNGLKLEDGLRLDILVDEKIILELKAQEGNLLIWEAQLLSYLKLTGKRLGYLLNFHHPLMKNGIRRLIN